MKQLKFLIARIDRIGDVVLSTPLPREIKKKYPNSYISILVKNYTKDIYLNNPFVDSIITFDNENSTEKSFWSLVKEIRSLHFTHAFMLLPQEKLNYVLFASGIPYRVGVGHRLFQFLTFTKYINRKKYNPLRHESEYCLDMLRKVGIEVESNLPDIFLDKNETEQVKNNKEKLKEGKKIIIGVNVSSGNSAPNLTMEEYKKLILNLKENNNYKILVMDKIIPEDIDNISDVLYPNIGNNLRDSIINFACLDMLISNSTGPMHICAALKIPTLALFCPLTACSPKLWGPVGNKSEIILPTQEYCNKNCPIDPKKCDYSKEGGLKAEYIVERTNHFINSLK